MGPDWGSPVVDVPGARPGHRIAVADGITQRHVALHAQARSEGWTLIPLNTRRTPEGMAAQAEALGAQMLVCGPDHWEVWEASTLPGVALHADGGVDEQRGTVPDPSGEPGYHVVLETSGTTRDPRPVTITDAMLAAHAKGASDRLEQTPTSAWLLCIPLFHIGGVSLVDRCQRDHLRLELLPKFTPKAFMDKVERVTHVSLVPTQLRRIVREKHRAPPGLRCVLLGGDRCPPDLFEDALELGWPVWPTYGLTECCGQVTTATPDEANRRRGTVGRPIPGVHVRIVHGDDPLPAGAEGEIEVKGVACGGTVRTGDIGVLTPDGFLEVRGRHDDRIITGGENVDPMQVEEALVSHPAIKEACVVGLPDAEWGARVAAAVVMGRDEHPDVLAKFVARRLPAHAVPRLWFKVKKLPRTASGKLRRGRMREKLLQATDAT